MTAGSEDRIGPPGPASGLCPSLNLLAPDMRCTGALLLAAFLLPMWDPPLWTFPNIEGLERGDGFYGLFLVFPLIAGLSLLALSRDRHAGWKRGAFLLGLGLLPFMILLAVPAIHPDAPFYLFFFNPKGPSYLRVRVVASFLGIAALYAGLRGAAFEPGREDFRRLALGGAILMVGLQLLAPCTSNDLIGNRFHSLSDILASLWGIQKTGKIELWLVRAGKGVGLILFLFCLYRAIEPAFRKNFPERCRVARQGFTALWLSYVINWAPQVLVSLFQPWEGKVGVTVNMLKVFLWLAGLAMVLPVGLLDYLLARPRPGAETTGSPGWGPEESGPGGSGSGGAARGEAAGPGRTSDSESESDTDSDPDSGRR
ncbi:MAG: hypothetical protein KA419_15105 [Acidobacteria bacterium]|nr:hypothetical protein [Acidobacteriota bacterium]